jgi:hypothetical protein
MPFKRLRWMWVIALLYLLLPISACRPCQREVDGHCYDKPDKNLPGIKASWQAIDAETLKPIPDAFVLIGWREFPANAKSFCVLNELGRTDKDGRYTTRGKNGSWMIESASVSALDYNAFRPVNGFEKLTRKVTVPWDANDTFRVWRQRFLEAGYQHHQNQNEMERSFAVNSEDVVNLSPFFPNGRTVYMTNDPIMPTHAGMDAGVGCLKKPEEPDVAAKGDSKHNVERFGSLFRAYKAYLALCDDAWDSVPEGTENMSMTKIASDATYLIDDDLQTRMAFMSKYKLILNIDPTNRHPTFSSETRRQICTDLRDKAAEAHSALQLTGKGQTK